jgi:uncharacterized cupin superfamily protein
MIKINIEKPTEKQLKELNVKSWPIWEKEKSKFSWLYDEMETCYILEGKANVKTKEKTVTFGAGDLVTFPAGLECEWEILEDVRKRYKIG